MSGKGEIVVQAGTGALMPVLSIEAALERRSIFVEYVKQLMVDGMDYGTIPGTPKPTLHKPGAEKLCTLFGFVPEFEAVQVVEDWTGQDHAGEPFFFYRYRCRLFRHGMAVGEGFGSCNSFESRYRWRWVKEDEVPRHLDRDKLVCRAGSITEFAFAVDKAETSGQYGKPADYWQRFKDAIQSGTARLISKQTKSGKQMDAWEIDATVYRVPNDDIASQVNTIDKMAQKRSLVAAVLIAANASEFFTQDIEDMGIIDAPAVEVSVPDPEPALAPQPAQQPRDKWDRPDWNVLFYDEALAIEDGYYQHRKHINNALKQHGYTTLRRDQADEMLQALRRHAKQRMAEAEVEEADPIPF
jgi:hypothetical protein